MTSPHIITRTKALDENIRLLNSIPTDLSKEILKRVQLMEEFQDDYDDLAKQYGLEKNKISSVTETLYYLHKQLSKVILNPSDMKTFLMEYLRIETVLAHLLVDAWTEHLRSNFDLKNKRKLSNISWELNAQASSTFIKKESSLNSSIQLKFVDKSHEDIIMKLDEEEILHLYNMLENIQTKLDTI
ncbi:hypothetical protein WA026_023580 [Henosepilachna vigintioctopunctata]|uniref:COMM domain-containing protein n=1 Tax=Henosepilachna vigintioctopunctata TaxID=420089 RepID=A0AAW1UVX5_9CUCU